MKAQKLIAYAITTMVLAFCLLSSPVLAAVGSSQNYSMEAHAFDQGGLKSDSGGHDLISAVGQASPIGVSKSGNYSLYAGLINAWCPSCDTDGDSITDNVENGSCTDWQDADTDDDGIADGLEDLNRNGVVDQGETNPCVLDSDGDGVGDGTETGLTYDDVGPETDPNIFQPDLDPSTTTDPLDPDSDDDGNNDGFYDANHTGRSDPWEQEQGVKFPPSADAGPDRTVQTGVQVSLDGGNSRDIDGLIATWKWTRKAGPPGDPDQENAVVTHFTPAQTGAYIFELTVTDNDGLESKDVCIINAPPAGASPPVADAGPDQTVNQGALVTLDGSGSSDPDQDIADYQWTQLEGTPAILSNDTDAAPTFTARQVANTGQALVFLLTVTDQEGLISTDTATVNITWDNNPPVASAGPDQIAARGSSVLLDGSGVDPDGGAVYYSWRQTAGPPVTLSNPFLPDPTATIPLTVSHGDVLVFELSIIDSKGLVDRDSMSITVEGTQMPLMDCMDDGPIVITTEGGDLVWWEYVDPSTLPGFDAADVFMPCTMFTLRFVPNQVGGEIEVKFNLPSPAPEDYTWVKYSPGNGWFAFTRVQFNADRTEMTLTFMDGGIGDDDNMANGIIIDPGGLGMAGDAAVKRGLALEQDNDGNGSGSSGSGSSGFICFVSSADSESEWMPLTMLLTLALSCAAFVFHRRRFAKK